MEIHLWQIITISLLLTISAIAKAVQDTLSHHYWKSIFTKAKPESYWDANMSWENKYKWFPKSKILTWLISNPFVFATDAWHTFSLIRDFSIFLCIPIISQCYWILIGYILYRLIFHVFYSYIFVKKG